MKENDIVVNLPGFNNNGCDDNYGGCGYIEGLIYKVRCVDSDVVWSNDFSHGVYKKAVRLATLDEIKAYTKGIRYIKLINRKQNYLIY